MENFEIGQIVSVRKKYQSERSLHEIKNIEYSFLSRTKLPLTLVLDNGDIVETADARHCTPTELAKYFYAKWREGYPKPKFAPGGPVKNMPFVLGEYIKFTRKGSKYEGKIFQFEKYTDDKKMCRVKSEENKIMVYLNSQFCIRASAFEIARYKQEDDQIKIGSYVIATRHNIFGTCIGIDINFIADTGYITIKTSNSKVKVAKSLCRKATDEEITKYRKKKLINIFDNMKNTTALNFDEIHSAAGAIYDPLGFIKSDVKETVLINREQLKTYFANAPLGQMTAVKKLAEKYFTDPFLDNAQIPKCELTVCVIGAKPNIVADFKKHFGLKTKVTKEVVRYLNVYPEGQFQNHLTEEIARKTARKNAIAVAVKMVGSYEVEE